RERKRPAVGDRLVLRNRLGRRGRLGLLRDDDRRGHGHRRRGRRLSATGQANRGRDREELVPAHLAASMMIFTGVPSLGISSGLVSSFRYFSSFIVSDVWQTVSLVTG